MQNPAGTRNATDVSRVGQVLITDGNLEVVDEGVEYIVHAEKSILDGSALDLHLGFASRSDRGQQDGRVVHDPAWEGMSTGCSPCCAPSNALWS